MHRNNADGIVGCAIAGVFYLTILAVVAFVGTISLDYAVETWAHTLGHPNVEVPATNPIVWVAGLILSEVAIPVALVTYLLVVSGVI